MLDSDTSGGRSLQGRSAVHGYTVEVLEERIGYRFRDVALLKQAMTHSSFTNEQKIRKTQNYERLEFLGMRCWNWCPASFCSEGTRRCPKGN